MGKIIRRILTIIPAVALQSLWLLLLMKWLTPYAPIIVSLLSVAAFFLVVFIIIKRDETAYKLLWLLVILSLPLVGALLYLLFGNKRTARPLKRRLQQVQKSCNPQPLPIKEAPFDGEKRMGQTVRWLEEKTQYPMCAVEQVRYYPLGDNMFPDMLADLKNARKYSQVHVLGTVNNVPQLMQASDLFLTKPGGLSTSEAMAAELPMVLIDAVAGCETHNLNFFLRNGMAVTANTPKAIADTTIKTLNAPVLLSKMRAAMRSQTECTAADKIYEWIYSHAK